MTGLRASEQWGEADRIDQLARAQAIAVVAHRGQRDKLGAPYIAHPRAVASAFDPETQPVERCAALLHDVVEDSDISLDDLAAAGIAADVIEIVALLTRAPGQGDEYYVAIREHPAARNVKLADIAHNQDPDRVAALQDEAQRARLAAKYAHARGILGA